MSSVLPCLSEEICRAQEVDDEVAEVKQCLLSGNDLPSGSSLAPVKNQLCVINGAVHRSVKVPPSDVVSVPVIPPSLTQQVLTAAHQVTGQAAWDAMYKLLRTRCFFPRIAVACQEYIQRCIACNAANPQSSESVPPSRPVSPSGPWEVVQLDTLELGPSRSGRYHCVLVCVDTFTKWVEVQPLERHDAQSVAAAFVFICCRWGAPQVVRSDIGTEFRNALVSAVYKAFEVTVAHGAVRHPQSQGAAERFNQTLLTTIRKVLSESDDWVLDLDLLLYYYYRVRPHSATGVSPMKAMSGWSPRGLVID